MIRGLYTAAAGMVAEQTRQTQLANDLANAATPGYKRDRTTQTTFGDVLLSNVRTGEAVGPVGNGPYADATVTDLRAQPTRTTDEPLDLAVEGDGYFAIATDQGVRYTRNGQFSVSARGTLCDRAGNDVLDTAGRAIRVGADGSLDPRRVAIVALDGPTKVGEGFFTGDAAGAASGTVRQGMLETSGVDPTRAMVEMIASLRTFEAGQRSISTIDQTLGRAATQVGNPTGQS